MKYLINLKNEFPLNHPDYAQQGFLFIDILDWRHTHCNAIF